MTLAWCLLMIDRGTRPGEPQDSTRGTWPSAAGTSRLHHHLLSTNTGVCRAMRHQLPTQTWCFMVLCHCSCYVFYCLYPTYYLLAFLLFFILTTNASEILFVLYCRYHAYFLKIYVCSHNLISFNLHFFFFIYIFCIHTYLSTGLPLYTYIKHSNFSIINNNNNRPIMLPLPIYDNCRIFFTVLFFLQ